MTHFSVYNSSSLCNRQVTGTAPVADLQIRPVEKQRTDSGDTTIAWNFIANQWPDEIEQSEGRAICVRPTQPAGFPPGNGLK